MKGHMVGAGGVTSIIAGAEGRDAGLFCMCNAKPLFCAEL